jgi:hypothetical protein
MALDEAVPRALLQRTTDTIGTRQGRVVTRG